jgi:hypothetical protein
VTTGGAPPREEVLQPRLPLHDEPVGVGHAQGDRAAHEGDRRGACPAEVLGGGRPTA